jgi:hypothetical protein
MDESVRASMAATSWSEGTLDGIAGAVIAGGTSSRVISGARKVGGASDASAITMSLSSSAVLDHSVELELVNFGLFLRFSTINLSRPAGHTLVRVG